MKTATLKICLFQFDELSKTAQKKAIEQHADFMEQEGQEYENEKGELVTSYERPTDDVVVDNIEINEYYFYEDGNLAHTIKNTSTGETHYISKKHKVLI